MSKAKTVGWVIASPFILIALGIAFCELNKAYWDHKVKQWCEKDGGVTVYEHIMISREDRLKLRLASSKEKISEIKPYYLDSEVETIRNGSPSLRKGVSKLYRASDGKLLGEVVKYSRSGGDFPLTQINASTFSCLDIGLKANVEQSVFVIEDK